MNWIKNRHTLNVTGMCIYFTVKFFIKYSIFKDESCTASNRHNYLDRYVMLRGLCEQSLNYHPVDCEYHKSSFQSVVTGMQNIYRVEIWYPGSGFVTQHKRCLGSDSDSDIMTRGHRSPYLIFMEERHHEWKRHIVNALFSLYSFYTSKTSK